MPPSDPTRRKQKIRRRWRSLLGFYPRFRTNYRPIWRLVDSSVAFSLKSCTISVDLLNDLAETKKPLPMAWHRLCTARYSSAGSTTYHQPIKPATWLPSFQPRGDMALEPYPLALSNSWISSTEMQAARIHGLNEFRSGQATARWVLDVYHDS